ncbi:putative bifunctional diguanylate cyclase/phosphodiesterase [Granulosicoccus sp. 3-233]|uniref:putative bifunctional diguanylate cyclase/phosphodiesterase n=1 Tax=Granulosicoccus sp. 3-233 TaxID=3417969 RepID=UPI003D335ED9
MKLTFNARVLLLLAGLVLLVQLANLSVVLSTLSSDVRDQMNGDLETGSSLVVQLVDKRSDLLLTSAEVLAADFGFRAAIASQDKTTILSALRNNISRIDADLAVLVTVDGELVGESGSLAADRRIYLKLAEAAEHEGVGAHTYVVDGYARELVSVPVKAPLTIGWLVVGFSLDDAMARAFSEQVGMEVSFSAKGSNDSLFGSSLDQLRRADLPAAMRDLSLQEVPPVMWLDGEEYLSKLVPISSGEQPVSVVLNTSLHAALASYRDVRNRLLIYMGLSLIIALALAFWFAGGVTRPIKQLSTAALRIREGDYEHSIDAQKDVQRSDEIGELIQTFGEMQAGIAKREATITFHAYHDELTGLPNRRRAQDQLLGVMEIARIKKRDNAVILLGMKRYKQIVDTLGHKAGEAIVKGVAQRLPELCTDADLVARVSQDEFLVLVPRCNADRAESLVLEWMEALEQPVILSTAELVPELSAGVILLPKHASTVDAAMRRASIALSDSRELQIPVSHYEKGRDESYIRKLSIIADLKRAVDQDELTIHFQPKITMQTGQVESVEALVRWIHPEHGFMAPDEFIGLAESSGNIGLLTGWVLDTVVGQLGSWQGAGIELKAAVNLSALDLQDEQLLDRIKKLLARHQVAPARLILEVTESAMMKDTERALQTLATMRDFGLTISIDDFGTGYSSLSKLKDLPINELKIDRAFVTDIEAGSTKAMIMKAIIDLGHGMGLKVVSEGVETQAEWDLLAELGNDVVQGYLVSRPLPVADFNSWWQERFGCDTSAAA